MKKTLCLALVVMAGAVGGTVSAKDKKDKKKPAAVETPVKVTPVTPDDSLSFAAGVMLTQGLDSYLQQMGVQENLKGEVVRGFQNAIAQRGDSVFKAYSTGQQVADMVVNRMLPSIQGELGDALKEEQLIAGFLAALQGDYTIYDEAAAQKAFDEGRNAAKAKANEGTRVAGEQFLADNRTKPGVVTLPSGLQYKVLKEGQGPKPTVDDQVEVIYEGRTLDGNVFDSTEKHGTKSDTFGVGHLIKGWTEALTMMPVGSKWEIYIPQELAYGERGAGEHIKPYSALVFTLELLGIKGQEGKQAPELDKPVNTSLNNAASQPKIHPRKPGRK